MSPPDPNFRKAVVGDHIQLASPLKIGVVEGLLVDIDASEEGPIIHHYKLYLFGVDVGDAYAVEQREGSTIWEIE